MLSSLLSGGSRAEGRPATLHGGTSVSLSCSKPRARVECGLGILLFENNVSGEELRSEHTFQPAKSQKEVRRAKTTVYLRAQ